MNPNLDKLAAMAPFTWDGSYESDWIEGGAGNIADIDDIADALNEWAELRATVAELRQWRSEHDCRYTLGAVADIDGIHCPIDDPCVRCQRRMEWDAAQQELVELRAYKQRTEEGLASLTDWIADRRGHPGLEQFEDIVRTNGLWRDPAPKEAK